MECPKCGKKNKKGAEKCIVCGKQLIKKNAKEKTQDLIESITSTIDVKAIKKAERSLLYNLKHIPTKVIVSAIIVVLLVFTMVFVSIGFHSVTCTFKSNDKDESYRINISFNYKDDKVTRFTMRQEYSASTNAHKEEYKNFYNNIVSELKNKDNYAEIVSASKGRKHFTIVYKFSPKYIDQVNEYTSIDLEEYQSVKEFVNSLEKANFKCR